MSETAKKNLIVVVMGVSGSGKSTVGEMLARRTNAVFFDADDYHPAENKAKMSAGIPLNDGDRAGWLATLSSLLRESGKKGNVVLACSALKQSYRDVLRAGSELRFVYLKGSYESVLAQMKGRSGHYMKTDMLKSQFAILEEPSDAVTVQIGKAAGDLVDEILVRLDAR